MLDEFIALNHDDILAHSRDHVQGMSLFLTQLSETLRLETAASPFSNDAIGSAARRHGAELWAAGFTVSQVVHDYGDVGRAITQVAVEHHAAITAEEVRTLIRCLDTAVADAVAERTRLTAQKQLDDEAERFGHAAHELRDHLNGALLAFHVLKGGTVPVNGSVGAVLGRSLTSLQTVVDRGVAEVRVGAARQRRQAISVTALVDEIAATGALHSECRGVRFLVAPVDPALALEADPHLLGSAMMNLLHNAFKNTRAGGVVSLRARAEGERLLVEIEDECGGLPEGRADLALAFGNPRGSDRSGLGLGLSIARKVVRAHGGDIRVRNMPGRGCVFAIDVPLAGRDVRVPQSS